MISTSSLYLLNFSYSELIVIQFYRRSHVAKQRKIFLMFFSSLILLKRINHNTWYPPSCITLFSKFPPIMLTMLMNGKRVQLLKNEISNVIEQQDQECYCIQHVIMGF